MQRLGVVTRKTSPGLPDGGQSDLARRVARSRLHLQLRADPGAATVSARIDGVGDVRMFGARDYAMRVWIDPGRAAALDLTAGDIVQSAARAERPGRGGFARPAGLDAQAAMPSSSTSRRRAASPGSGANSASVVIRTGPDGRQVRVCDVGPGRAGRGGLFRLQHLSLEQADRDPRRLPAAGLERAARRAKRQARS